MGSYTVLAGLDPLGGPSALEGGNDPSTAVITDAAWALSGDAGDFAKDDGDYLFAGISVATFDKGDDDFELRSTTDGIFVDIVVGTCVYVGSTDGTTPISTYYEVLELDDWDNGGGEQNNVLVVNPTSLNGGTMITAESITINIGGIVGTVDDAALQGLFDDIGPDCGATDGNAINNLNILINQDSTLAATVDIDNISGSSTTRVKLIGTTAAFVDDGASRVVVDVNAAGVLTSLFDIGTTQVNVQFYRFTLDATNAGAGANATHALNTQDGTTAGGFTTWHDCIFENSTGDCILNDAGANTGYRFALQLYNPIIRGSSAGAGLGTNSANDNVVYIGGGKVHNNFGIGIKQSGAGGVFEGVQVYDNGDGFFFEASSKGGLVQNCTIDGNGDAFIFDGLGGSSDDFLIINCAITNNTGVDFNPSGVQFQGWYVANCLLNGNGTTYDPVIGIMTQVNIVTDPPQYEDQPANDYTPATGSPLIDAGVGGTGDTIGALCAAAGAAGGGGIIINPGMTGGIGG